MIFMFHILIAISILLVGLVVYDAIRYRKQLTSQDYINYIFVMIFIVAGLGSFFVMM